MLRRTFLATLLFLTVIACTPQKTTPSNLGVESHGKLPLIFEANRGQAGDDVQYLTRSAGYSVLFKATEAVFVLENGKKDLPETVRMRLEGARTDTAIPTSQRAPGNVNYFIGNDPSQWRTGIPVFSSVKYESVYPGVDLAYHGSNRQLEFDFIVAPGANPNVIDVVFEGSRDADLDANGDLLMGTLAGRIRLHKPGIYQETGNGRREIAGAYVLKSNGHFGFQVSDYDPASPIVIDPVLSYSTYVGGNELDLGLAIAVDGNGNSYVTGSTSSTDLPTLRAIQPSFGGGEGDDRGDAFIAKLNPDGSAFVYCTYFGGRDTDVGLAVAVDSDGNTYVTGTTLSENFPAQNGFQSGSQGYFDAFVTKLDSQGSVIFSTYLGGTGFDRADGIAVDSERSVYITGRSLSEGSFPIKNAFRSSGNGAFVTKLDPTGRTVVYSTFLGPQWEGWSIAVDSDGGAYVTGLDADFGMFVARLLPTGSGLVYLTSLGGDTDFDDFYINRGRIAVDGAGNTYVVGYAYANFGNPFITTNALQPTIRGDGDAFIAKLNQAGIRIYSTFLGGNGMERAVSVASDSEGNAYITGVTSSSDFPTVDPLYTFATRAGNPSFLTKLNPTGTSILFSTYLHGEVGPIAIAADAVGDVYMTGVAGPSDFPLASALQGKYGGGETDAFITKIGFSTRASQSAFQTGDRGGFSQIARGLGSAVVGYGRIVPSVGNTTPNGVAIFGFRQNGVLVSEVGVQASPLLRNGRLYAEVGGSVNTGVALANPNGQAVDISFVFTDLAGQDSIRGNMTLPPNGQTARFLNESPFKVGSSFRGTLTLTASAPIGITALRGLTNERSEFLMTTLPVAEVSNSASSGTLIASHFADGGGWATAVVLVNSTDSPESGSLQFIGQGSGNASAQPAIVTIDGQQRDTFSYSIPARSVVRFQTSGLPQGVQAGSVRIAPAANSRSPLAFVVFAFKAGGVTVSEASVAAQPAGSAFRMYVEASGPVGPFGRGAAGSIQSGIAVANALPAPAAVTFEITTLSGGATGLSGSISVPGQGQVAVFLNQIPGFETMPQQFQGILRISTSASSGIAVTGLRGRYNERGDFLITTTSAANEATPASNDEVMFPHLVAGGGYTTQVVLFSGASGQTSSGVLRFVNQSGQAFNLSLR